MGSSGITKRHPDMGFALGGLKSACARWEQNGALDRKVGSGAKRKSRAADAVEDTRAFFGENDRGTCGEAVSQFGLSRGPARRIISHDLDLRPIRQISTHRVKADNAAKRLAMCRIWEEGFRVGELDSAKIFFADEKVFRPVACPGGGGGSKLRGLR